ncbi:ATP-binding protein [Candidatus Woesearchaeota archaeon]|nr:ATP-binding protein [Candidatus Woesearchaeota archaeon]
MDADHSTKDSEANITNSNRSLQDHLQDYLDTIHKKDILREKNWRFSDLTNESPPEPQKLAERSKPLDRRTQVLQSLDAVFVDDALKDDIITRTAIPDLLEGTEPAYTGVILFGPPGTGKTVLLKAIGEVYRKTGAYTREVAISSVNTPLVGQFAKNLEEHIQMALREAAVRGMPSFLYFDEGSILVQDAGEGTYGVSKHYQEAIDVLKRYIGNDRNLVVGISTNLLPESFEDALTRDGRLTTFFIGYPDVEQRKRMWKHFTSEYNLMTLTEEQALKLAEATPEEQGAFIEEFARNYRRSRRTAILREKGYSSLVDALKQKVNVTEAEVRQSISFDNLYTDLDMALKTKYERAEKKENARQAIGFNV